MDSNNVRSYSHLHFLASFFFSLINNLVILKVHSFESTCFLRSIWKNLFFLCLKSMTKCFNPIIKCCLKRPSLNLTITKDYKHLWIKAFLKEFIAFKIEYCLKTLQTHLHAIFKHDIDVDMNSIELDFSHILTFQLKSSLAAFYFLCTACFNCVIESCFLNKIDRRRVRPSPSLQQVVIKQEYDFKFHAVLPF